MEHLSQVFKMECSLPSKCPQNQKVKPRTWTERDKILLIQHMLVLEKMENRQQIQNKIEKQGENPMQQLINLKPSVTKEENPAIEIQTIIWQHLSSKLGMKKVKDYRNKWVWKNTLRWWTTSWTSIMEVLVVKVNLSFLIIMIEIKLWTNKLSVANKIKWCKCRWCQSHHGHQHLIIKLHSSLKRVFYKLILKNFNSLKDNKLLNGVQFHFW